MPPVITYHLQKETYPYYFSLSDSISQPAIYGFSTFYLRGKGKQ